MSRRKKVNKKRQLQKKRRLNVGSAFDGEIRLIEAKRTIREDCVRERIVAAILAVTVFLLLAAAAVGARNGSYDELRAVWLAAGPLTGGILTYYFQKRGKN